MKKNVLVFLLISISIFVSSCGGGGGGYIPNQNTNIVKLNVVNEPIGLTPFYIRDLPANIMQEPTIKDQWAFSVRHQNSDIISLEIPESIDTISKTGLKLDNNIPLRGNGRGSFYRSFNNNFESYIDTSSSNYETVIGGGPHSVVSYEFKTGRNVIGTTITGDFSIPTLQTVGDSVGQLSIIGYLSDGKSTIAFVFPIFDNRYDTFIPMAMSDTAVSFVSQPINSTKYAIPYNSEKMIKTTFEEYKTYGVTFTRNGLDNIIEDINIFNNKNKFPLISTDANNYKFILLGVLHEVFLMNNPNNIIKSGISFKNLSIFNIQ